jgi:hypothetical protein
MALRLPLTLLLASAPLAAQDYAPDLPRIEALTARVEAGETALRPQLERVGRPLLIWAAQRRVSGTTAHLVARIGFIFGPPFTSPDASVVLREKFWRGAIVSALKGALAADSGDVVAAERLEQLASYPHVWMAAEREFLHLRAIGRLHDTLPLSLALAWLGMELERGDPDTAATALRMITPQQVGEARWHHLAAQVAFARNDSSAPAHYTRGAQAIQSVEDAKAFRLDLGWIAEPHELVAWDSLPFDGTAHAAWLQRFWMRRDLEDLRTPGTRLREHFARWRLALREYRWDREGLRVAGWDAAPAMGLEYNGRPGLGDTRYPRSRYMGDAELYYAGRLRPLSVILDDRGAAVMRHGPPDEEVELPGITGQGQTMFAWHKPWGTMVMSFSRPGVAMVPFSQPNELWGMIARNMPVGDLKSGCAVDPELCVLAGLVEAGGDPEIQSTRTRNRYDEHRRVAEVTESNVERFAEPLEAYVQSYGIAGGGVLVSYAVRARDLEGGLARLRIVAGSLADGQIVAAIESDRRWRATSNPDAFVAGWTMVDAPVGTWHLGVVLSDSARQRGSGSVFEQVPVIAGTGCTTLCLSDPILGRESSGLRWNRLGRSIPLNPTGAWLRSEEGVLSAEVYGLVPGRTYALALELRNGTAPDAPARIAVAEHVVADATTMFLQRNLSFANLDPGTYRLVVRITDTETGASVERERRVPVR